MREIRTFQLEEDGAPTRWTADGRQTLVVRRGMVWLTVPGLLNDFWLRENETFDLAPHSTIWLSGIGGSEVAIAEERPTRAQAGSRLRTLLWGR
ncbi:DUF2917 domain-containing protein [Burkholderia ubonensis]|uniref:DUF2917 domain-containing protein n=1 Tax=Burkholderia ubonensis subsp. mesacidophila TaxID=265293 RepID=A0A2A4EKP3_9BURK|nr:DUF2917 domain-containing protein [Burkholderia ubonensis]PCE21693.1 hypothetical protein BZL54_34750 [Burkholderia ubonensis subsp. mesacidophila]